MNLFRSEEHLRNWRLFDPAMIDGCLPVADWARVFNLRAFASRLDSDSLAKAAEYGPEAFGAFMALGKTGFWAPPAPPPGA